MLVVTDSQSFNADNKTVVGVGFFDGFHIGHSKILDDVLAEAKKKSALSVVYTYRSHPDKIIKNINTPLLMSIESRIGYLGKKGFNILCMDEFDRSYAAISAEDFIEHILIGRLNATTVVAGFNYTFGDKGRGDTDFLVSYGKAAGIDVHIIPPVIVNGEVVSSTLIRSLVASGNMEKAALMLGRPYSIEGTVSTGKKIGRKIGYPTANILLDSSLVLPQNGVYITATLIDGVLYESVTNIGVNPTVGGGSRVRCETHIFNFSMEIYMKRIKVYFMKKLRDEMKFINKRHLAEQISQDVTSADSEWRKAGGAKKWLQSI